MHNLFLLFVVLLAAVHSPVTLSYTTSAFYLDVHAQTCSTAGPAVSTRVARGLAES